MEKGIDPTVMDWGVSSEYQGKKQGRTVLRLPRNLW